MINASSTSVSAAVESRRSVRAFSARAVDGALVRRILDVARRAPSGGNLQPWYVHVLGGADLTQFRALIESKTAAGEGADGPGYDIYPKDLRDPYRARRYQCGEDMYACLSIPRENKPARYAFIAGNYRFWDAPVGMFFSIDKSMGPPQWSDLGMYIQTVMLLAREAGLHTCPQESWTNWHRTVADFLGLPDGRALFCGLALGYADEEHNVNRLRTQRAELSEFAVFRDI
jgi:nitroreductase